MSIYTDQLADALKTSEDDQDWIDSIDDVMRQRGPEEVGRLLRILQIHAQKKGIVLPVTSQTPYMNTIPPDREPPYPGNREIERRIKSIIRWNAMAMVVRANRESAGIGGHISSYASSATLYEVGFNHFFRGKNHSCGGDVVYYQGHTTPGMYARAYVEGRLTEEHLRNFRRELKPGGGLSSYPHPWLMPEFWEYPTVSMGLGPLQSIYRARFMRYLADRGLQPERDARVWCFVGDGESDEPETLGAITLAAREQLDNLIWVVNCNLQRLDGPVRGNGKIIQELEAIFRGSGWNVVKALWGSDWDPLFEKDTDGLLVRKLGQMVDGEYQKLRVEDGAYIRKHVFESAGLERLVSHLSDDQLWYLRLGGHDPGKVYAAYKAAVDTKNAPTVVLAKTIKGYGLGEAGEGKNITHQQKKLNEQEMLHFRDRFDIPISDEDIGDAPFYRPAEDSIEMQYIRERMAALGGPVPARRAAVPVTFDLPSDDLYQEFDAGTGDREVSTTMAFVRILAKLLRDKSLGKHVVPIVPDEARTFGMEALFRQVGIYSHVGQLYEPVDSDTLLYYKEVQDGQILEEGINEAGSMCSFISSGTSDRAHGVHTIPFYIYYSMFGHQRIGDLVWAAGDMRCRGFMLGGTAGRTTLAGEGLQHQDGHSHVLFSTVPNVRCYDPAYAYEIATIIRDGMRRMYGEGEEIFYYLTVGNENYAHPEKPAGSEEGILNGMYLLAPSEMTGAKLHAQLLGSGSILNETLKAQRMLAEDYRVAADVWSITSYTELRRNALDVERWNMLHPMDKPRRAFVTEQLADAAGVIVAASDYIKALPDSVAKWMPRHPVSLGTDGFGRSETRASLRDFFEVDARWITAATLSALAADGQMETSRVVQAMHDLGIDLEKADPLYV